MVKVFPDWFDLWADQLGLDFLQAGAGALLGHAPLAGFIDSYLFGLDFLYSEIRFYQSAKGQRRKKEVGGIEEIFAVTQITQISADNTDIKTG